METRYFVFNKPNDPNTRNPLLFLKTDSSGNYMTYVRQNEEKKSIVHLSLILDFVRQGHFKEITEEEADHLYQHRPLANLTKMSIDWKVLNPENLPALMEEIKRLEEVINPPDKIGTVGSISLTIHTDMGWSLEVEYSGRLIGRFSPESRVFDYCVPQSDIRQDWEQEIIDNINKAM